MRTRATTNAGLHCRPLDSAQFIAGLQQRLIVGLDRLDRRSAIGRPAGCGSARGTTSHGSLSRRSAACLMRRNRRRCTPRSNAATGCSTCSTCSRRPTTCPGSPDVCSRSPPGRSPTPTPHGDASCSSRSHSGRTSGSSGSPTRLKGIPTTPRRRCAGSGGSTSPARTSAPRSSGSSTRRSRSATSCSGARAPCTSDSKQLGS